MTTHEALELGKSILKNSQTLRVAVEGNAVPLQLSDQILNTGFKIKTSITDRTQRWIKTLHLLQLMAAGLQMIDG